MKVLIVEDELPAAQRIERLLKEIEPGIEIAGRLESVEGTINWWLHNSHPDLLLMDIQLEDGLCFEIFENTTITTPVIFITAYDEFALKAFKVNSIDYLLKPVGRDDLKNAIKKYRLFFQNDEYRRKLDNLINQVQPAVKERFLIRIGEHYKSIPIVNINCFFIREKCNFIMTDQGRQYPVDYSLEKVEKLIDPGKFFRVSRNFIINFQAIRDIISYSTSRLKILLSGWNDKEEIIVSRERVREFKEWMDR